MSTGIRDAIRHGVDAAEPEPEPDARAGGSGSADDPGEVAVVVIDADPLALRSVRRELERAGAMPITEASCARDGIELARRLAPDVVFVGLPHPDALEAITVLAALGLGIRPVLLCVGLDPDAVVAALRAGARGCVAKSDLLECDLARLLRAAINGELVCSRAMSAAVVERLTRAPALSAGYRPVRSPLTAREWEVLDLLCASRSTDQIAETLVISTETVRTHVKHMMRKLGARSRDEVVAHADRLRTDSPPPTVRIPRPAPRGDR